MRPRVSRVVALVVGLGAFPILAEPAYAQPTARAESHQSAVAGLTAPPLTVQSEPKRIASTSATLRVQATRGDPTDEPVGFPQVAALPHPDSAPTPSREKPDLSTARSPKAPRDTTPSRRLPLAFIENKGQVDAQARFYLRAGSQTLWLTSDGIVFDFLKPKPGSDETTANAAGDADNQSRPFLPLPNRGEGWGEGRVAEHERLVFAQDLIGANKGVRIEASQPLPGTYNYFPRSDPATWRTKVRGYAEVAYRDVWNGIDLKLLGNGRDLEQEFIVKPGADPSQIQIAYRGIEALRVADDGSLIIKTASGDLRESRPRIFQEINGKRVEVAGRFRLRDKTRYAFEIDSYQPQYALVIDPTLIYSTYLGGGQEGPFGGAAEDEGRGIAVDLNGNAYVTGFTKSIDFPTKVPFQGGLGTGATQAAFITKLNPTGSALIYSTYLGRQTVSNAIAVDAAGAAYLTGGVPGPIFCRECFVPITPGAAVEQAAGNSDGFVTKLSADGSTLVYSTFLPKGGQADGRGDGIAVDPTGNAYIAADVGFGASRTPMVIKLNATGTETLYFMALGGLIIGSGNFGVPAMGIAIDAEGSAYAAGSTLSPDFPTTEGAFQRAGLGRRGVGGFVVKVNASGAVVYSTLLAGDVQDNATGIAVDISGHAYVIGWTESPGFPTTPGAFQTTKRGGVDAFVTKLKPDGSGLVWSTFLGGVPGAAGGGLGGSDTLGAGIAVDSEGQPHVTGLTTTPNFPTTPDAFQPNNAGGDTDVFLTKLNASGSALLYSTFLGGATAHGRDIGQAIALDLLGDAYLTGSTNSDTDFPTTPGGGFPPFQRLNAGGVSDAFVAKFSTGTPTAFSVSAIVPTAGGDTGSVTMVVNGFAIQPGATVKLVRSGESDIVGDPLSVGTDGRTIAATFDLVGKPRGAWDVVVTNAGGAVTTLPGAFTVEEGRSAQVWVDIVGRDIVLVGRGQTFYLLIGNLGNIDAIGFYFWLAGIPLNATLTLDSKVVPLPLPEGLTPNRTSGVIETAEFRGVLPFFIPVVPPGITESVQVKLTIPAPTSFQMDVIGAGQ